MTDIIRALADLSGRYDAVFCDLWGCLHNGQTAYPAAVAALQGFRAAGDLIVAVAGALGTAPRLHDAPPPGSGRAGRSRMIPPESRVKAKPPESPRAIGVTPS